MSEGDWFAEQRTGLATTLILDAAAELFVSKGVAQTTMEDVARAAGCSRATVYRYFDDREALRRAYVHRETREVATTVAGAVEQISDPAARVVAAVLRAVEEVRGHPALAAWFAAGNLDVTHELVGSSELINGLATAFLGSEADPEAGAWLVRIVVSLLTMPGGDQAEERSLIERFVAPVVVEADLVKDPAGATPSPLSRT